MGGAGLSAVEIRADDPLGATARALVAELDDDLRARYPGQSIDPASPHELSVFLVARVDGRPAGCGALRPRGDEGEVVRMYVRPEARRRGVARAVLRGLERAAREAGHRALVLETGDNQEEAVALYRSEGFEPAGPYGAQVSCPHSLFFRKPLDVPQGILELRRRDIAASKAGDPAALRALWTDDAVVLPPGEPAVRGEGMAGAFRAMAAALQGVEVLDYEESFEETLVLGDHAVEWGTIRGRERDRATGTVRTESFKVMRILRRMPDGSWRVHRSIWNDAPGKEGP